MQRLRALEMSLNDGNWNIAAEPEVVDGAAAKSVLEQAAVSEPPAEEPEEAKEPKKVKKNRCASCKKKVGLTGFACR